MGELINDGRVAVVAPNPDTVAKAQVFRHGLIDAWRDPQRVTFAMFSRAPVVDGSRLHHEAELLGSVNGPCRGGAGRGGAGIRMADWHRLIDFQPTTHARESGADAIIVDDMIDSANTLVRVAEVCKVDQPNTHTKTHMTSSAPHW